MLKYYESLRESNLTARATEYRRRLHAEFLDAYRRGWYIIFNTLTISSEHYLDFTFNGNRHVSQYNRSIGRAVCSHIYGSRRAGEDIPVSDYYRYFGVPELGGKTGRLHFHTFHFCKDIPDSWKKDPMPHANSVNVVIDALRPYWKFGISLPQAVRIDTGDVWSKLGWFWPNKRVSNRVIPKDIFGIGRAAGYPVKYITKDKFSRMNRKGDCLWRVAMSRNFGNQCLEKLIPDNKAAFQILHGCRMFDLKYGKHSNQILPPRRLLINYALRKLGPHLRDKALVSRVFRMPTARVPLQKFLTRCQAELRPKFARITSGILQSFLKERCFESRSLFDLRAENARFQTIFACRSDVNEVLEPYTLPNNYSCKGYNHGNL